jgi:hypothetical protein
VRGRGVLEAPRRRAIFHTPGGGDGATVDHLQDFVGKALTGLPLF